MSSHVSHRRGVHPLFHSSDAACVGPQPGGPANTSLRPLTCSACGTLHPPAPTAVCPECLGPLEPSYPPDRPLPSTTALSRRPASLWRYLEWLPFEEEPQLSRNTGFTPLIEAPILAAALGVRRAWIKNDALCFPSLSFKDRVVATAINAARQLGLDTVGCASTGNLANAVAAHAAREGLSAWIFVPHDLEGGKLVATAVFGAKMVRVRGTYDDVNRLCSQVADHFGWGIVNVNLRAYYAEGSKTMAWEIAEQLGWRFPDAVVVPMAGGSLVTRLAKGFREVKEAGFTGDPLPRLYGAQAAGCAPIVEALHRGDGRIRPTIPRTLAKSLAIGSPADGAQAVRALRESGGWAAAVDDLALVGGIQLLARTTGIFTETAGGVTVAAALALARQGHLKLTDEVVLCITGHGLKTVEAVRSGLEEAPLIAPRLQEVEALITTT